MSEPDEDNVIDAEIVENLPAVQQGNLSNRRQSDRYAAGERNFDRPPPSAKRDADLEANPLRRCSARKKDGSICRRWAIKGGNVCTHHGTNQAALSAARARVEKAADKLMRKLIEFAYDDTKPPATQLEAIKDSLNRAGLKPSQSVVLSQGNAPYEEVFESLANTTRAESRAARGVAEEPSRETLGYEFGGESGARDGASMPSASAYNSDGAEENWSEPSRASEASETFGFDPAASSSDAPRDRQRNAQAPTRHIVGDRALEIAGQLARQKAIESGHKRYLRP